MTGTIYNSIIVSAAAPGSDHSTGPGGDRAFHPRARQCYDEKILPNTGKMFTHKPSSLRRPSTLNDSTSRLNLNIVASSSSRADRQRLSPLDLRKFFTGGVRFFVFYFIVCQ